MHFLNSNLPRLILVLALGTRLFGLANADQSTCDPGQVQPGKMKRHSLALFNLEKCKKVYFVRHAEAIHNSHKIQMPTLYKQKSHTEEYRDTHLTDVGRDQSRMLFKQLEKASIHKDVELIVSSPLRRAIQTATLSFHSKTSERNIPIIASELARERISVHACDWRSKKSTLEAEFPHVDFSLLDHDEDILWHDKEDHPSEHSSEKCHDRAIDLLSFLMERPEQHIAVVSHWVFLKHLFRQFGRDIKFKNAQCVPMNLCQG